METQDTSGESRQEASPPPATPEAYRMYRKPICRFADKAAALLKDRGISFEEHLLENSQLESVFKSEHRVKTTPQIFVGERRIGGYSDLAMEMGVSEDESAEKDSAPPERSYRPVIAVFSTTALMALVSGAGILGFMGFSLCVLALLKFMDTEAFRAGFSRYDLVSQRFPAYARAYPFIEVFLGLGFLAGVMGSLVGLLSLAVGASGCYSIYQAVYVEKKSLTCACVGGRSAVPLGAVSFSENLMMVLMGLVLVF